MAGHSDRGRAAPGPSRLADPQRAGIRSTETENSELLASVRVGQIADLAVVDPGGWVVAVEVELSIKSASRLVAICRGWARARHLEKVCYLATDGPVRAVGRAVRSTNSADRVTILAPGEVATLAQRLLSPRQVKPCLTSPS